jgi:pyridoxal phosphate enzyme (YggS family)
MSAVSAGEAYRRIRDYLPEHIVLVIAAKGRRTEELAGVINAGARVLGENYVQEAERHAGELGPQADRAEWHMIGRLQTNKVNRALALFDLVQTLDSVRLAAALDKRAKEPVRALVEVNVGGESTKSGFPPQAVPAALREISRLPNVRVEGLMTMEPYMLEPEDARPYFRQLRELFVRLRDMAIPNVAMRTLSMGMTHSYRVAVDEGATMVRIGTAIFGPRP